jgi:hypothetical protein
MKKKINLFHIIYNFRSKLGDIKELQKSRERQKGVNIVGLALGKKIPKTEDVDSVNILLFIAISLALYI